VVLLELVTWCPLQQLVLALALNCHSACLSVSSASDSKVWCLDGTSLLSRPVCHIFATPHTVQMQRDAVDPSLNTGGATTPLRFGKKHISCQDKEGAGSRSSGWTKS
jgi:hypothetical protein